MSHPEPIHDVPIQEEPINVETIQEAVHDVPIQEEPSNVETIQEAVHDVPNYEETIQEVVHDVPNHEETIQEVVHDVPIQEEPINVETIQEVVHDVPNHEETIQEPNQDEIIFSITKSMMKSIISKFNYADWKILRKIVAKLIACGCEIFGGAARDFVYRDHCANIFYAKFLQTYNRKATSEDYDNPNLFPETYAGRTLLPPDLDVFVKGEVNFDKVRKYLIETFECRIYDHEKKPDIKDPDNPYFIDSNPDLKKVLKYYSIPLSNLWRSEQLKEKIKVLREFFPGIIVDLFNKAPIMKLDIIVLVDNWKKINIDNHNYEDESRFCPPFNNPDFRCNQLSLVKSDNFENTYVLRANCNFKPISLRKYKNGLLGYINNEIIEQESKTESLKIIIDDIIAQRAVSVLSKRLVDSHRIAKMEKKGYTVNIAPILPKSLVYKTPLKDDDKCPICFEALDNSTATIKPCECAGLMHAKCWAQNIYMNETINSNHYHYNCPCCRNQLEMCVKYPKYSCTTCQIVNMLLAVDYYKMDDNEFKKIICKKCNAQDHEHESDDY
jgi:hypothetical protein